MPHACVHATAVWFAPCVSDPHLSNERSDGNSFAGAFLLLRLTKICSSLLLCRQGYDRPQLRGAPMFPRLVGIGICIYGCWSAGLK